ncbi:MAG: outer membrane beta-barrel protein [Chitinophagaceae bacterium]
MSKRLSILFLLALLYQVIFAQEGIVSGMVRDTAENKKVVHAVVMLSRKADSTLISSTRTDKEGNFQLHKIPLGTYILLVTFPKFADFSDEVSVKDSLLDLGSIALTNESTLLKEVIVRGGSAIRIKGDTTEFSADSFTVKEGATVEDLLKRLPGFQVNSKGEINVQGKRVEKVLVDGEEFFGDDPTMATQNLGAKAVDKVQLFDTKSEQQQLTGTSSGTEGKTLNIKLKEDSKKGAFGKINAGSDLQKYVDAKALYNRFKGKKKVSLYGTTSNVSTGSLNWEDQQKLGIENDYEYDELSGVGSRLNDDVDDFNNWSLRGLPHSYSAGGLFIDKWNQDKQGVNTSYRYNWLRTDNEASTFTQNILPTTINYRNKFTTSEGMNQQHAANGKWEWKKDSLTSFKFTTAGSYKETQVLAEVKSEFLNNQKETVNTSDQDRDNHTTRTRWDNQLLYKQLFNKKNRQLLTIIRFGLIDDAQNGVNKTKTSFYRNNAVDSIDIIDQMRTLDGASKTLGLKMTYSEPLSTKWMLVFDYAHNRSNASSYRNTFSKNSNGKYETLDPVFSNNFDLDAYSHSGMGLLRFTDKKLKGVIGSGLSSVKLKLYNVDRNVGNSYDFINHKPLAQLSYMPKAQTNISLTYRGTTLQPTIEQLQPIRNNEDPLYEFRGNSDLKVGFRHGFESNFYQYKVLSQRYIYVYSSYSIVENAISNFTIIDTSLGKQIYMPVNTNGNRNWNLYGGWQKRRGPKKLSYGVQLNGNGGLNNSFIQQKNNVVKNKTDYKMLNLAVSIDYEEEGKKNFTIRPKIGYNTSKSSVQSGIKNNYFTYGGNVNGFVMLPGKLELSSEVNIDLRQKLPNFPSNQNFVIWNASLSKKVLKKKTGKIIIDANDVLNQNRGFNRIINTSFVQEERYNRLSRYFLLRFEWTFNKMPGSATSK